MAEIGQEEPKISRNPIHQKQVEALGEIISGQTSNPNKITINKLARTGVAGQLRIERLKRDFRKEKLEKEKTQKEKEVEKKRADEAEELSLLDPLTGLLNRRGMDKKIDELIARARRDETTAKEKGVEFKRSFAILYMDVNNLKLINDLSKDQHSSGDIILKAFANALKKEARPSDVIARVGGDEFVIILESTDLEGGLMYINRKNKELANYNNGEYEVGPIGISAGLVEANMDNIQEKIKEADQAAGLAKHEGRVQTNTPIVVKTEKDLEAVLVK